MPAEVSTASAPLNCTSPRESSGDACKWPAKWGWIGKHYAVGRASLPRANCPKLSLAWPTMDHWLALGASANAGGLLVSKTQLRHNLLICQPSVDKSQKAHAADQSVPQSHLSGEIYATFGSAPAINAGAASGGASGDRRFLPA